MQLQYLIREDVYERIWQASLTATAKEIGIAPTALAAHALAMAIPRPTTGYWSKLRAGKPVVRPPLLPRPPGAALWVQIGWPSFWDQTETEVLAEPAPPEPVFTESLEELGDRLASQLVPSSSALPGRVTLLSEWRSQPVSRGRRAYRPAPPDPRRAFLVQLSAFLGSFVASPEIWEVESGRFFIRVHATIAEFRLSPPGENAERPAALLFSRAVVDGAKTYFSATNDRTLEAQLPDIGVAILLAAEASYRQEAQHLYQRKMEYRHKAEAKLHRRKVADKHLRERQKREQAEGRRQRLFDQAGDWQTARDIRGLVAEVMSGTYGKRKTRRLQAWADWALSEADLIDPVKQGRLIPPTEVRKAMRERLAHRHTADPHTVSSPKHFTESAR